jgi:anti-sigma factor RsiW
MSGPAIGDVELSAWLDGEASPERRTAIENYLKSEPDAAARVEVWRRQNEIVRARYARVAAESPPEWVWPSIGKTDRRVASLRDPDAPIRIDRLARRHRGHQLKLALGFCACFAAGAATVLAIAAPLGVTPSALLAAHGDLSALAFPARSPLEALARRAADANRAFVRDLGRPVEIAGDRPLLVNEFLSQRIGVEVSAPSLDNQGTRLLGARLTPGDVSPLGLLVYEDPDGARFGLVIGRAAGSEGAPQQVFARRASAVVAWSARGAEFALVGPNDPARVSRLARTLEAKAPASAFAAEGAARANP